MKAKLINIRKTLERLQNDKRRTRVLFAARTEAKIYELQRQIADVQSILDKRMSDRRH